MILVLCAQLPDLGGGAYRFSADRRQMDQEEPSSPEGIMPCLLDDDQGQVGLVEHCQLPRQVEHSGIGADQAVPLAQVMERKEQLPIIHSAQSWIDLADRDQVGLWHTDPECLDDGVRKILVQRETGHASGNPLEPDVVLELLFEVDAVLQGVRTGKGIDSGKLFQ